MGDCFRREKNNGTGKNDGAGARGDNPQIFL